MADTTTASTSTVGDFGLGDSIKQMQDQVRLVNQRTAEDRAAIDKNAASENAALSDIDASIKYIPPPNLSTDSKDRDPNKYWQQGQPDISDKFAATDYRKMGFATIAMLALGALTGGGRGSLAALGGVMKGFLNGRDERNQVALEKWKADADAVATHNQQLGQHYSDIINAQNLTVQQKLAKLQAATKINDDALGNKIATDNNGLAPMTALINARARAAETILRFSATGGGAKIYDDRMKSLETAIKDDNAAIDKAQAQNTTITKALESEGSLTLFGDELTKQGLPVNRQKLNEIRANNEKTIKQFTAKKGNDQYMYDQYQTREMNASTDNPEVTRNFINAGAAYGSVGKVGDKYYRYDQKGSHEITKAEYDSSQQAAGQADTASQVGQDTGGGI